MAQIQCDLQKYFKKIISTREEEEGDDDFDLEAGSRVCKICEKIVSKGNFTRHASYHLRCNFCSGFHYLKDLKEGKCPAYNELMARFFPSAAQLKINLFDL
jgi:hypothetical protein